MNEEVMEVPQLRFLAGRRDSTLRLHHSRPVCQSPVGVRPSFVRMTLRLRIRQRCDGISWPSIIDLELRS